MKRDKEGSFKSGYNEEYCKMLVDHMALGKSFRSFARIVDTTERTLYRWAEEHDDFQEAREKGISASRLFWEEMGIEGTRGDIERFQPSSWALNMRSRFRDEWSDPKQITVESSVKEKPVELIEMSPQERRKYIAQMKDQLESLEAMDAQIVEAKSES